MADVVRQLLAETEDARALTREQGRALMLRAGICPGCAWRTLAPGQEVCAPCARGEDGDEP